MDTVKVELGDRGYPVHVGRGLLARLSEWTSALSPARAALLYDDGVPFSLLDRAARALEAAGFSLARVTVRAGEASKCLEKAEQVLDELVDAGLDRSSPLFVMGGGMVCDLGGFCAAVLYRGVPLVLLPTTLLAQLDAAIGGKTAVNLLAGKNLVGAFWQPRLVVADIDALATLPSAELCAGLAEAVKCGLVGDPGLLDRLEAQAEQVVAGDLALLHDIVLRAVRVKAAIVARDERETGDERIWLNLGHTVGHALEASGDLRHGQAVALGLVAAVRVGRRLGVTPADLEGRIVRLLSALGLPTNLDEKVAAGGLEAMSIDKKRLGAAIRFVCIRAPGQPMVVPLSPAEVLENLRA